MAEPRTKRSSKSGLNPALAPTQQFVQQRQIEVHRFAADCGEFPNARRVCDAPNVEHVVFPALLAGILHATFDFDYGAHKRSLSVGFRLRTGSVP